MKIQCNAANPNVKCNLCTCAVWMSNSEWPPYALQADVKPWSHINCFECNETFRNGDSFSHRMLKTGAPGLVLWSHRHRSSKDVHEWWRFFLHSEQLWGHDAHQSERPRRYGASLRSWCWPLRETASLVQKIHPNGHKTVCMISMFGPHYVIYFYLESSGSHQEHMSPSSMLCQLFGSCALKNRFLSIPRHSKILRHISRVFGTWFMVSCVSPFRIIYGVTLIINNQKKTENSCKLTDWFMDVIGIHHKTNFIFWDADVACFQDSLILSISNSVTP